MKSNKILRIGTDISGPIHMFFKYGNFTDKKKLLDGRFVCGTGRYHCDCFISKFSNKNIPTDMSIRLDLDKYLMWCK